MDQAVDDATRQPDEGPIRLRRFGKRRTPAEMPIVRATSGRGDAAR
jgi:hypothetical protein